MSCKEYKIKIYQYLDGELPEGIAMQLEDHLKNCKSCQAVLASAKSIDSIIEGEKNEYKFDPYMSSRVIAKLSNKTSHSIESTNSFRYVTFATLAAAGIAIGIFIGSFFTTNSILFDSSSNQVVDQLADEYMPYEDSNPYNFEITDNENQVKP